MGGSLGSFLHLSVSARSLKRVISYLDDASLPVHCHIQYLSFILFVLWQEANTLSGESFQAPCLSKLGSRRDLVGLPPLSRSFLTLDKHADTSQEPRVIPLRRVYMYTDLDNLQVWDTQNSNFKHCPAQTKRFTFKDNVYFLINRKIHLIWGIRWNIYQSLTIVPAFFWCCLTVYTSAINLLQSTASNDMFCLLPVWSLNWILRK